MIITKEFLSGSDYGTAITIDASGAGSPTSVHTAATSGTNDEVWIYATNNHTADVELTLIINSKEIKKTITTKDGLVCIIPGFILSNTYTITAYAGTINVIDIYGFVNRIA